MIIKEGFILFVPFNYLFKILSSGFSYYIRFCYFFSYGCSATPDPLQAVSEFVSAYHKVTPLEEEEIEMLFDLIVAR
jgi:hypothetical protein